MADVEIDNTNEVEVEEAGKVEENEQSEKEDVFYLCVDLARTLMGWSWEGTIGIDRIVGRVAEAYKSVLDKDTIQCVIPTAEVAIVKMGYVRTEVIRVVPGFPTLAALNGVKTWFHQVEAGELTPQRARLELDKIAAMEGVYHPLVRLLGIIFLDIGFAIDLVGTWEGIVVCIITSVVTWVCFMVAEMGQGWSLAMPFLAAFVVSFLVLIVDKHTDVLDGSPVLLMIPSLFVFIPGDNITMQAVELMEGSWTAGTARLFYALVSTKYCRIDPAKESIYIIYIYIYISWFVSHATCCAPCSTLRRCLYYWRPVHCWQ